MADEATTTAETTQTEAQATETQTTQTTGDATGTNSGNTERTFNQADVERIVGERLQRDREARQRDADKAEEKRKQKELEAQGEYKKIADDLQAKLDAAEKTARDSELKLLRRDAAAQTNLPAALADRLQGETLEEMVADAKTILAALPRPAAPNINAQSGAGGAPAVGQMSDAEKQELAARLGVNPMYM